MAPTDTLDQQIADVSHWHPVVSERELAKAHLAGLIGKVSDGAGGHDATWISNRDLARRAGISRIGGYHFHRTSVDPVKQRDAFFSHYGDHGLCNVKATIDVEDPHASVEPARHADDLHVLVDLFRLELGELPMLYTGSWWWVPHIGTHAPWAAELALWLSGYIAHEPKGPAPWSRLPELWQKTSTAPIPGIAGLADLSVATSAGLAAITSGAPITPPVFPPTGEGPMSAAEVAAINAHTDEKANEVLHGVALLLGADKDSDPGVAQMVRSMFLGGYGEEKKADGSKLAAVGNLGFLDRHLRARLEEALRPVLEKIDALAP